MPLFWKVVLVNGAVFCVGTIALVLSPVSVSRDPVSSEVLVLAVGLTAVLATNAVLLRRPLGQIDRVVREMAATHAPTDGQRLAEPRGEGPDALLVRGWNQMLDRLESERGESNARTLAAQEAERQRIARELHDQIGQDLTVVLLGLKRVVDRAASAPVHELVDELELVRESARVSLDDVRRVARELRPGVLSDLGLASALAALATEIAIAGPHVRRQITPGLPTLSPEVEVVLYRVAQEALTNAARHAGATSVDLSLARVGAEVVLEVVDDGRGLAGAAAGSGIRGMRERALLVGGRVEVDSPGRGTRVRLLVPWPPATLVGTLDDVGAARSQGGRR
ncbi:sensor histidine kinase [Nocardioides sp. R-C-SC26]|uniref:sensor histidine kinase n=1 Tax=Nocardioides sp. R-C-SC26 TaxID=2870414 RepID=UPI001E3C59B1|nr:histidine kinase [Nocardioides sp. R-C-SC26]